MRTLRACSFVGLVAISCSEPRPFPGEDTLIASSQHVLAIVDTERATTGWLYRYELEGGGWHMAGEPIAINVGSGGVGKTREGDRKAPSGAYDLTMAFGYAEAPPPGLRMPYLPLLPETECVDDEASKYYNEIVVPSILSAGKTWKSSEMMRRDLHSKDDLYKLGLVVDYNPDGGWTADSTRGAGSCIFIHIWRGPGVPTVGCTSMSEDDLTTLLSWLNVQSRPLLVQGSRAELERLAKAGRFLYPLPPRRRAG